MKVHSERKPKAFEPIEFTIVIETQAELNALRALTYFSNPVSSLVSERVRDSESGVVDDVEAWRIESILDEIWKEIDYE